MWEDDQCKNGGKWALRVPKTHSNKYWEDLLLALIGDQFTHENEVHGININLRPTMDNLQIWNKSGKDDTLITQLKDDIENILRLEETSTPEDRIKLEYENFAETLAHFAQKKKEGGGAHEKKHWNEHNTDSGSGWERPGRGRGRGRGFHPPGNQE